MLRDEIWCFVSWKGTINMISMDYYWLEELRIHAYAFVFSIQNDVFFSPYAAEGLSLLILR